MHLTCAAALFILLGAISLFIFPDGIARDRKDRKQRVRWYRGLGAVIWLSIILMPVLNMLAGSFYDNNHVFFALEAICVTAFAVSFILAGHGQPGNPDFSSAAGQPPVARGEAAVPAETPRQPEHATQAAADS